MDADIERTGFEATTTCCGDALMPYKLNQPNLAMPVPCCN